MITYSENTDKIELFDDGARFKSYSYPTELGYWEITDDGAQAIAQGDVDQSTNLVVFVGAGRRGIVKLPDESTARPYAKLTFAQINNRVDTLTAPQLRRVVAWLIWLNRENITDDFTRKLR